MLKRIALLVVTALFPMIALGQGLSDNEMFEIMRESAGPKVTDQQIENVISAVRNAGAVRAPGSRAVLVEHDGA